MDLAASTSGSLALCLTAVTVGVVHTLLGPDHYVPFVAMAKAGNWPLAKTLRATTVCGLAHVTGSIVIGLAGLALGAAVMRLEEFETLRGDVAAWLMIGCGLAITTWGLVRAARSRPPHDHVHVHADGTIHAHAHRHDTDHLHLHVADAEKTAPQATPVWSPWLLFLVFAFGPCEPLIPLLMYPAAKASWLTVAAVALAFAAATIATMSLAVVVLRSGISWMPTLGLQRYAHALAGAAILACGVLITLGL